MSSSLLKKRKSKRKPGNPAPMRPTRLKDLLTCSPDGGRLLVMQMLEWISDRVKASGTNLTHGVSSLWIVRMRQSSGRRCPSNRLSLACLTFLCSDIHLTTASRSFRTLPLAFSFILCCCFVRFLSGISYSAIKMTFLAELTDLFNNILFYRSVAQLQSRKRLLRFCWHLADVVCQRMRACDAIDRRDFIKWPLKTDRGN